MRFLAIAGAGCTVSQQDAFGLSMATQRDKALTLNRAAAGSTKRPHCRDGRVFLFGEGSAVRCCWLAKAKRVCSPGEGKGDGSLLRPNLLPVGAFGKDHVTQASNFDTGVQDAAEVMHRLAPSGSMSLSTTRSQASPPRPGFVVGPRIG
jgi:hypothetical protein